MPADRPPPPGPERDRALAAQPRHRPRYAAAAGSLVAGWMRGPEGARLRRNRKVAGALRAVLDERELERVVPVGIRQGTLTLAVRDAILLSELRNHRHGRLVHELVERGTGIGRVVYRIQRSP